MRKSKRNISKTYENYYISVDEFPIWNWNEVYSKGNFHQLHKKGKGKAVDLVQVYDILMDDYIKVFGLNKKSKQLNKLKTQLINRNLQFIESDSRVLWNKIEKLKSEIKTLQSEFFTQSSEEFNKNHVLLQKWYGQKIDLKETTVLEYQSIAKLYEQSNKKERNSRRRGSR